MSFNPSFHFRLRDLPFLLLLGLVAYLCLRPSSHLQDFAWVPGILASWSDAHDSLPHVLGFGVLAFAGFLCRLPLRWVAASSGWRATLGLNCAFFFLLAVLLEIPHLWIATRGFNLDDIAAGWIGIALAATAYALLRRTAERLRPRYSVLKPR